MTVFRVQVSMERDTQVPADRIVNTLHYQSQLAGVPVEAEPGDGELLTEAVLAAWTPWMASLFGVSLSGAVTVTTYDVADPEPRVPLYEQTDLSNTVGTTGLPAELAVCLSFQGPTISGVNQARRRGRIFLGPLPTTAMDTGVVGDIGVASTYRTNAISLGQALTPITIGGTAEAHLGVLSRRNMDDGMTPDEAFVKATEFFVDNAFDVQRKRGKVATVRSTAVVA